MSQEPFIICDNLVKIYKMADLEVVALQGLDLVVQEGELMALVGPSGSGKSTLMNTLGGLDRPSAGRVLVSGRDLLKMTDAQLNKYRREEVGFVWQQPGRNLIPYMTASENVTLPMTITGIGAQEKHRRANELLEMVGLGSRKKHRVLQLSGGEQQRVSIAVALANYPRLVLADEPTGEVDSQMAQEILGTLRRLNRELGVTIIIVTHDPRIASEVDRVIAIRDGRTSTETTRQVIAPLEGFDEQENGEENGDLEHQVLYEELVVVDTAGRLQVPRNYLEEFGIGDRARVEVTDEGILIQPVQGREAVARVADHDTWEAHVGSLYARQDAPPSPAHKVKGVVSWLKGRLKGNSRR